MKIFIGSLLLIFSGLIVAAQGQQKTPAPPTAVPPMPAAPAAPRILAEIAGGSQVKGSPFSAEAVNESVQTLADGNRIVRSWNEKLYRSSEGKFRREGTGTPGTALGWSVGGGDTGVTIVDPVGGFRYVYDLDSRVARASAYRSATPVIVNGEGQARTIIVSPKAMPEGDKAATAAAEKAVIELNSAMSAEKQATLAQQTAELKAATARLATAGSNIAVFGSAGGDLKAAVKFDTRTEQLGMQNIEGVDCEGTRTTTTIPAGSIGNERPIEIVYEKWYSKDLQMIVYSKHSDPRFGEQTYRLTNINRSEPDPSLFEVPAGYKLQSQNTPGAYRVMATPRPVARVVPVKNVSSTTVTKP